MANSTQVNITNNDTAYLERVNALMTEWNVGTHMVCEQREAEKTDSRQQRVAEEGRGRQRKRARLSKTSRSRLASEVLLTAHLLQRVSEDEVASHFAHHNVS